METDYHTRRALLKALIAIPLVAACAWRFLLLPKRKGQGALRIPRRNIPAEGALVMPELRLVVLQQSDRVLARSLVCTHLGCTVTVTTDAMVCPCHGSRFDRLGVVLQGPAEKPLAPIPVMIDGQDILVEEQG